MNDHYYTAEPTSEHREREFEAELLGQTLIFTTDSGVFSKDGIDKGTRILLEALPELRGRVLDLGCGWGAIGVTLGKAYPNLEIVMTDINTRAAELARRSLKRNGVTATVVTGDAFENVEGTFDAIITNPPIRAGKQLIYGMFAEARERLNAGGALYIVIRKQQGAASAEKFLKETYGNVEMLDRESGYHIYRAVKA